MLISVFILAVFLNSPLPILMTNVFIKKIDNFRTEFVDGEIKEFSKFIGQDIKNAFEQKKFDELGSEFVVPAVQKIISLRETISDMKEKVATFLKNKDDETLEQISTMLINLRLNKNEMEALKRAKKLIKLITKADHFLFGINVQAHYTLWGHNLVKLEKTSSELEERKRWEEEFGNENGNSANAFEQISELIKSGLTNKKLEKGWVENFAKENSANAFQIISEQMEVVKMGLRDSKAKWEMDNGLEKRKREGKLISSFLVTNEKILLWAINEKNPLFEFVEELLEPYKGVVKAVESIYRQQQRLWELINKKVEQFPNVLMADEYFGQKQKVWDLHFLNNACLEMYNYMAALFGGKILANQKNYFLAHFKWLADFIEEKKQKIEKNKVKINLAKELAVSHVDEEKIFKNVEEILKIFAKMKEIHNFENAIEQIKNVMPEEQGKKKIKNLVMTGILPENVALLFYGKYLEEKKKEMSKWKTLKANFHKAVKIGSKEQQKPNEE